jgi:4-nitrophenyl phosphatase
MTSARLYRDGDHGFLLDKYDTWMFDCDGVLWHGDTLVRGAVEVLKQLRQKSEIDV